MPSYTPILSSNSNNSSRPSVFALISVKRLRFDACAQHLEKLREPGVERGPRGAGDEISVGVGLVHWEIYPSTLGERDVDARSWIGAALSAFEDSRGGEKLRGMTDGGDGFLGFVEVADHFQDSGI